MASLQFPQVPQADFIGALQQAQLYRMREQEMRRAQGKLLQEQQEAERQRQIQMLQGAALQGDPNAMYQLQGVAPQQAIEMQAAQQKQQAGRVETRTNRLKMEDMERQEMLRRFDQQINLFEHAQRNPAMVPVVTRMMVEQGLAPPDDLAEFQQLSADDIPEVISGLKLQRQTLESNEGFQKLRNLQTYVQEHERQFGAMPAAQLRKLYQDFGAKEFAPGAGMQINIGDNQPATSGTRTDLQKDIRGGMESLASLQQLKRTYNDGYRTWAGQARQFAGRVASFAGFSFDKEFRQKAATWRVEMDQFFNAYKKEITGSAAAVQEIEDLKKSIVSSDTDPDLVPALIDQLVSKISRNNAIASELLSKGFPVGSEQYWKEFNVRVETDVHGEKEAKNNTDFLRSRRDEINVEHKRIMDSGKTRDQADAEIRERYKNAR